MHSLKSSLTESSLAPGQSSDTNDVENVDGDDPALDYAPEEIVSEGEREGERERESQT